MMHQDGISFSLLVSIPKKINAWLKFLAVDMDVKGQYKSLSWDFTDHNHQTFSLDADATGEYVGFEVTTNTARTFSEDDVDITPYEPWMVNCTEEWTKDIPIYMDRFITLEKRFYDVMEELTAQITKDAAERAKQND